MAKAKDPEPPRPKRAVRDAKTNLTTGSFQISDKLWEVLEPLIPERVNTHQFGGGRHGLPTAPVPTEPCTLLMQMGCELRRFQWERWTTLYWPMKSNRPLQSYFVGADFAPGANSQVFVKTMPDRPVDGAVRP